MCGHGVSKTILGLAIVILAASQSAVASESAGQIRAGLLLGYGMWDHDGVNGPFNEIADETRSALASSPDLVWELNEDELGGGLVYGVFAEYLVLDNLAVGAEFVPVSTDGGLDVFEEVEFEGDTYTFNGDIGADASARLLSVYGAYLLPLSGAPITLRLGGGVGYLSGAKLELNYDWSTRGPGMTEAGNENLDASGSAVAFHAFAGAEYRLLDNVVICANAAYRSASVDELEVDCMETSGQMGFFECVHEGEPLKWYNGDEDMYFTTEEGDNIGLDFGGFYLTASVAFTFTP